MNEWKKDISDIYASLPSKLKTYKNKVLLKSVALDWLLLEDFGAGVGLAIDVADAIVDLTVDRSEEQIARLTVALDAYYAWRRDDGRWEQKVFFGLKNFPIYPTFILSYNRPGHNATLNCFETWNDAELFENTLVFVQPDQEEAYKKRHTRRGTPNFIISPRQYQAWGKGSAKC